jgi:hypothetical protein
LVKWGLCDDLGVALASKKGAAKRKDCYVRSKPTGNEVKAKDKVPRRRTIDSYHHDESMAEIGTATAHTNVKGNANFEEPTAPKRRLAEGGVAGAGGEEYTLPKRRDRIVRSETTDGGGDGGGLDGQAKRNETEQLKQDESSNSTGDGDAVMDDSVPATEDTSMRVKRSLRSNDPRLEAIDAEDGEQDAEEADTTPTNAAALDHGGSKDRRARLRPRK